MTEELRLLLDGDYLTALSAARDAAQGLSMDAPRPQRVREALDYAVAVAGSTDVAGMTRVMIDSAYESVRVLQGFIDLYLADSTGNDGALDDVVMNCNALLEKIACWPRISDSNLVVESARIDLLHNRIDVEGSYLEDQFAEAESHIAELRIGLESRVDEVQLLLASREESLTLLTQQIDTQQARLDASIAEFQLQFSAAQEARASAWAQTSRDLDSEILTLLTDIRTAADVDLSEMRATGQGYLDNLDEYRSDAMRVVDAIGTAGMAEGFGKDAAEQRRSADSLRCAGVIALLCTAGWSIYALVSSHHTNSFNTNEFLARLVVSAILGSVAAYLIVQSAHHRNREAYGRKIALELASIEPYLARMPDEERTAVKSRLADAYFGNTVPETDETSDARVVSIPIAQLLKVLTGK